MTQPNQSELREHLSDILTGWLGAPEYNGFATSLDWGDLNTEIVTYITANYIPINQPSTNTTPVSDGGGGSESTNQSELEQQIVEYATTLLEARRTNDYQLELENRRLLTAYITANYTLTSEAAERERVARIDEIRRTRPHLTYPGMVYYGERMNELRSDETEEI